MTALYDDRTLTGRKGGLAHIYPGAKSASRCGVDAAIEGPLKAADAGVPVCPVCLSQQKAEQAEGEAAFKLGQGLAAAERAGEEP